MPEDLGRAAGADIGHGTHGGAGAGQPTEQSRNHVAESLAHKLAVRVVTGTRQGVGDQRCEQAVNGPQQGENNRRMNRRDQKAGGGQSHLQAG